MTGKFNGKFNWNYTLKKNRRIVRFIYVFLSLSIIFISIYIYLIIDRVPSREFFSPPPPSFLPLENSTENIGIDVSLQLKEEKEEDCVIYLRISLPVSTLYLYIFNYRSSSIERISLLYVAYYIVYRWNSIFLFLLTRNPLRNIHIYTLKIAWNRGLVSKDVSKGGGEDGKMARNFLAILKWK